MDQSTDKNKTQTIANIVSTIVLVISVLICVLVIVSMKSSSGVANLFGYSVLSVQSDSMDPTFYEHDLIVVKCTEPAHRFKQGDIVSFLAYDNTGVRFVNTHRIVKVDAGETRDRYTTKGDNAEAEDMKKLYSSNIIGEYTGKRVSGLGSIVDFINSPTGVLLCVVIPSAIIIIAQALSYASASQKRKRQLMLEAEERARNERIQLVNDVMAAQRGAVGGGYVQQMPQVPQLDTSQIDDPEKQRVIEEFLQRQAQEEAKKQAIIEEYLAKQKAAEEAAKEQAEAAKIKAIVSEILAQQKAGDPPADPDPSAEEQNQG